MLNHLINAKGGLHNRMTKSMLVEPFTLGETKEFFESKKITLTEKQILDVYIVMGGIPYYLDQFKKSLSVTQNIDLICFNKDGLLRTEFPRLFNSLFDMAELNQLLVREIAKYRFGVSLTALAKKISKKTGGRLQTRLYELEAAGFIQKFLPYGKKKRDHYYRIVDEYTLFYLKWIEPTVSGKMTPTTNHYWQYLSKSSAWQSWAGYAFESVCHKHMTQIAHALRIDHIACLAGGWRYIPKIGEKETSVQIDLLFDRADDAISICEIKYSAQLFLVNKNIAKEFLQKIELFQERTKSQKQLFFVLITPVGLKKNAWSEALIHQVVTLSDLMRPLL